MTRPLAVAAVIAFAGLTTAAPVPKAIKPPPPPALDGEWVLEREDRDGQLGVPPSSRYNRWRVAGGSLVLVADPSPQRDPLYRATLTSEPADAGPRPFEYVGENGYHRRGVCELTADTLRVAFGKTPTEPPAAVTSEGGGYLYTFKRAAADR